jgi:hypothetical protein
MGYIDFKNRRIWISSRIEGETITITCFPLRFSNLCAIAKHLGWGQRWTLVHGLQKGEPEKLEAFLDERGIPHTFIGEDRFLMRWDDLRQVGDRDFWSILISTFDEKPDEEVLCRCGVHSFKEDSFFKVSDDRTARRIWEYLIASHISSMGICTPERAHRYASNLPLSGWDGCKLLYWGYLEGEGSIELIYLILDDERSIRGDIRRDIGFLPERYLFSDDLRCLLLKEDSRREGRFGEVRDRAVQPIMPAMIRDHRNFLWRVIPKVEGYVFRMEPFRFRHIVDFLPLRRDAQLFYHVGSSQSTSFWEGVPARESGLYFCYDDTELYRPGLAEIQFVLVDPGVSAEEIEAILGRGEKSWFSSYEECEPYPPVDRFGIIWDEHVSLIYLRRDEDIKRLVAYTVWSLFRERFENFPNMIPDEEFCSEMLEYLKGIKGDVLIEWGDFSQEGDEYRLSVRRHVYGISIPFEELPEKDKARISFSDGNWRFERGKI